MSKPKFSPLNYDIDLTFIESDLVDLNITDSETVERGALDQRAQVVADQKSRERDRRPIGKRQY